MAYNQSRNYTRGRRSTGHINQNNQSNIFNHKLNSLVDSQQAFDKEFAITKKEFKDKRQVMTFYKQNSQAPAAYLNGFWKANVKKKSLCHIKRNSSALHDSENLRNSSYVRTNLKPEEKFAPKTEQDWLDNKSNLINFEQYLQDEINLPTMNCETAEHAFNVERVIALVHS